MNLRLIIEIAQKGKIDAIIHAGDWNTIEAVNEVFSSKLPVYGVLGNADIGSEVIRKVKNQFLIVKIGGKKIGITHKPSDNKKYFQGKELDLIINGHLHSKYESVETPVKIIRPGAIINGINFVVYDTGSGKIDFLNSNF